MNSVALIGFDARRLARNPVLWLVPVLVAVTSALDSARGGRNATYWYGTIFVAAAFFGPIFVLFAANLVASAARRARAEEILAVTPTAETRRNWAMCLGIALPSWAVGAVAAGAMALVDAFAPIAATDAQTAGELAQMPFILTGAGLLGVLAARRLRFAGGVVIAFVLATLGGVVLFGRFAAGLWWMWWSTATPFEGQAAAPGEPWLHVVYLAGLCACAAIAAVYRDRRRLLLLGAPTLVATLVVGWLQLQLP